MKFARVLLLVGGLAQAQIISVCEAARNADQLHGKSIKVRGTWRKAFPKAETLEELVDAHCPDIEIKVTATSSSLPTPPPAGYKIDLASVRKAQRIAQKALADQNDLTATIKGVFYVQKKEDYVAAKPLNRDLIVPPHHKWYPFVLLVESIPEVKEIGR